MLVVLYHLDLGWIKSGFLGVDIFFVISGFLMNLLYDHAHKKDFFIRRIKRLLPAYFATLLLTVVVATFITTPVEYNQVVKQALFGLFFSSNFGFWLQNSYFSKAEFNPLLHLWSLGVEIQFYLCVPLLAWLLRKSAYYFIGLLLLSMLGCFGLLAISAKTCFFMLPFRLWEFLMGYGVAAYLTQRGAVRYTRQGYIGLLGLLGISAIPLLHVDGAAASVLQGHPGFFALMICVATSLVLIFGLPAGLERSWLSTGLEWVGKYSYSIYLTHFPLIVLFLYQPFSGTVLTPNSVRNYLCLLGLILFLSYLMLHWVETSCRTLNKRQQILLGLAPVCVIVFCVIGGKVQQQLFSTQEMLIFNAWSDRDSYRCGYWFRIVHPLAKSCDLTPELAQAQPAVLLVGNSHADSIKRTFTAVAEALQRKVYFIVPNNPLMAGGMLPEAIVDEALFRGAKHIVLHFLTADGSVDPARIAELNAIAQHQGIKVSLIKQVPTWDEHIPKALYQHVRYGFKLPEQNAHDYQQRNAAFSAGLSRIISQNFTVFAVDQIFCQDLCRLQRAGKPLYFDSHHLTLTGSEELRPVFEQVLALL